MPDQQEAARPSDDRKVPVPEKAWDSHVAAAAECGVPAHPKAAIRAAQGP